MLDKWAGEKKLNKLPPEAAEVAKECGYLPLALAMVGAMVRPSKQPPAIAWQDTLNCLRASDLEEIKRSFPGYPYPDLLRAIEVSVEALDDPDRERYLDLAVFPEDQPIPETALRALWRLDARRTRKCMDAFAEYSLRNFSQSFPFSTFSSNPLTSTFRTWMWSIPASVRMLDNLVTGISFRIRSPPEVVIATYFPSMVLRRASWRAATASIPYSRDIRVRAAATRRSTSG
jgi:hypothetical protein